MLKVISNLLDLPLALCYFLLPVAGAQDACRPAATPGMNRAASYCKKRLPTLLPVQLAWTLDEASLFTLRLRQ
jgi:hypothetical protein